MMSEPTPEDSSNARDGGRENIDDDAGGTGVSPAAGEGGASRPVEISVEGLHKSFGQNHVLRGIDLTIHRGDLVAIVGGSGSGKTVLLDLMIGLMSPDRGRVRVADHEQPGSPLIDLDAADEEGMDRIRRHWAIVFQRNALLTGTVYDNIALWLREVKRLDEEEIRRIASAALESVGLDPAEVLERHRDDLSGGMAKRVAVARAVAMDPMLLFFDEPTTGLDPHHAQQIQQLIHKMHDRFGTAEGEGSRRHDTASSNDAAGDGNGTTTSPSARRTTIIITHDKDLLFRLKPRTVMLNGGVIHFDGPYEEFRRSTSEIIRPYFELMPALQQRAAPM